MDRNCRSIHYRPNRYRPNHQGPRRAAWALEECFQREQPVCPARGCGRPALTVDAYFPYLDDDNRCGKHTIAHLRLPDPVPPEQLPYG